MSISERRWILWYPTQIYKIFTEVENYRERIKINLDDRVFKLLFERERERERRFVCVLSRKTYKGLECSIAQSTDIQECARCAMSVDRPVNRPTL